MPLAALWRRLGCLCLALIWALPGPARADGEMQAQVRLQGEVVVVDLDFSVRASRAEVWAVLTDFEHMAGFISNLAVSRVVARTGDTLQVLQQGKAARGLLSYSFESLREVELLPPRLIRSRLLSGSMKKLDGLTELDAEGEATHVHFHGESIPGVWVPPVVGPAFIEREIREQFGEMRQEILRRQGAAS